MTTDGTSGSADYADYADSLDLQPKSTRCRQIAAAVSGWHGALRPHVDVQARRGRATREYELFVHGALHVNDARPKAARASLRICVIGVICG